MGGRDWEVEVGEVEGGWQWLGGGRGGGGGGRDIGGKWGRMEGKSK